MASVRDKPALTCIASVDAISSTNVWAVGRFLRATDGYRTLIEHWNGAVWRRVPSPNPAVSRFGSMLTSVSGRSASDIWAAGYDDPPGPTPTHTLTMHWNGGSWSVVRTPGGVGGARGFFGISATSASSAWAVGTAIDRDSRRAKLLVEHWNGQRWHQAPIVSPGTDYNALNSVSVVAPGNVWAVGTSTNSRGVQQPIVEHRAADRWNQVHPPGLDRVGFLTSVSGNGPNDVWAVGLVGRFSVLSHWNGHAWSLFHGVGSTTTTLFAVTTSGSSATWAVGQQYRARAIVPFKERWNGHVWTR